ncbi:unnamed protein product [Brassica oleracea var. botrytis]|uniref:(rape) hypothetical protein n=1 Tax=Brassica napus TaxID=3708 RepID=A0A816IKI2_BRANA|nr:unnamed protein product [Brassica napus]
MKRERRKDKIEKILTIRNSNLHDNYPDLSLSPTIPPRLTGTGEEGPGGQTETMLNPLWPKLELVMAGTSAEVPLPPDHEARFRYAIFL